MPLHQNRGLELGGARPLPEPNRTPSTGGLRQRSAAYASGWQPRGTTDYQLHIYEGVSGWRSSEQAGDPSLRHCPEWLLDKGQRRPSVGRRAGSIEAHDGNIAGNLQLLVADRMEGAVSLQIRAGEYRARAVRKC